MPNITYKSSYYLFILLHEKFFVTLSVYFVTCILIDSVQHVISCDPKSKLGTNWAERHGGRPRGVKSNLKKGKPRLF